METVNIVLLAALVAIEAYKLCVLLRRDRRTAAGPDAEKPLRSEPAEDAEDSEKPAERPARGSIDEGIENILGYSVGSRARGGGDE